MRLLVLGGANFVGRSIVAAGLARGWSVTTFTRGVSGSPPSGAEQLHGDRERADGLDVLAGREWDAVVDTWSGAPRAVRDSARLLAGSVPAYLYVSSRSVYRTPVAAGADEDAPIVDGSPDADNGEYATNKAGAEKAVLAAYGERALIARAGLILGPHEDVGRLPWWLSRMARGGWVLAPEPRDLPLQCIDARDLAEWMLNCAERGVSGVFNAVSRPGHATMAELLEACVAVTGAAAELRWTPAETILAQDVQPWIELPIWLPPGEPFDRYGLHSGDVSKAYAAGLRCRPVRDTVADTWAWMQDIGGPPPLRDDLPPPGLDADREAAILSGAG